MTIRDVSQEDRDRMAQKAEQAGQSLQEYLHAMVHERALREEPAELLARHRARLRASGGGTDLHADGIVALVDEARSER